MSVELPPATRLGAVDMLRLGTVGVWTRPTRTVLAALGIAIGIAALMCVIGIPASNQAAIRAELAALGPNLLTVTPGSDLTTGKPAKLPERAIAMIRRVGSVEAVSATGATGAKVYRSDRVPESESGGLAVAAARLDLLEAVKGTIRSGSFLNAATEQYPAVVLGARASAILGVEPLAGQPAPLVWISRQWFTVVGVLDPLPLHHSRLRSSWAGRWPSGTWRSTGARVGSSCGPTPPPWTRCAGCWAGRSTLGAPTGCWSPGRRTPWPRSGWWTGRTRRCCSASVGWRCSSAGSVWPTDVISVLERRREIGLRRALGASRRQVGGQFLAESVLMAGIGGGMGGLLGAGVTAGYAAFQHWPTVLPVGALLGAAGIAVAIGVLAGVYPAARAARLMPTEALSAQ
jgi:putative ABC transport system permease protein